MNKLLISAGILAASIALAGCGKDSQSNAPATASTVATAPAGVTHPMEPSPAPNPAPPAATSAPAPAATSAGYQIPPFPLTDVQVCDHYASEARRCLNRVATDEKRYAYERDITALLKKVAPEPGQPVNEWLTQDCHRGLDSLAQRYPQCAIQK